MKLTAEIKLDKLICNKSQESIDEPYLWVFYFKLDGTTVYQNPNNLLVPLSTIKIITPPGSGGSLGTTLSSGQSLFIPSTIGYHTDTLTSIKFNNIPLITGGQIIIPGMTGCFVTLIEQDSVPVYAMEATHQAVRLLFENEINDFIQKLSLINVYNGIVSASNLKPGDIPTPLQTKDYFISLISGLQTTITAKVKSLVTKTVIATLLQNSDYGGLIAAVEDPDDSFGNNYLLITVPELIDNSLTSLINMNFKSAANEWDYTLTGSIHLNISPQHPELDQNEQLISTSALQNGEGVITDSLCLKEPLTIIWTKEGHNETQDIWCDFTFGNESKIRWTVEGVQLTEGINDNTGTINPYVDTWDPVFDGKASPDCYSFTYIKKNINLGYEFLRVNNIPHLKLSNDPVDGVYSLTVTLELILPSSNVIFIDYTIVNFDGSAILIPDDVKKLLEECHNIDKARRAILNKRFTRVHKVTPKEIWGPYYRHQVFDSTINKLKELKDQNEISEPVFQELSVLIRQKFNLLQNENFSIGAKDQIE
ncbi:MAG: hypothetical protein ABJA37_05715 [Ferruginibacter sp.]